MTCMIVAEHAELGVISIPSRSGALPATIRNCNRFFKDLGGDIVVPPHRVIDWDAHDEVVRDRPDVHRHFHAPPGEAARAR